MQQVEGQAGPDRSREAGNRVHADAIIAGICDQHVA